MSVITQAVRSGKAKFEQKKTPVTNSGLLAVCFSQDDTRFIMGDLVVYLIEGYHYFISPSGKYIKLKNMHEVAKLVYGKTPYGV